MRAGSAAVVVIERLDAHGRVGERQRFDIPAGGRDITIGRGVTSDVILDDEFVAPVHATLHVTEDSHASITDLGTTNGIVAEGKRHHGAAGLEIVDGLVQLGRTRLRIRTPHEAIAPERRESHLHIEPGRLLHDPRWLAGLAGATAAAQSFYASWLEAPRDLLTSGATLLAAGAAGVALWVFLWALLSRVMQGEWRWLRHMAIALGVSVISSAFLAVHDASRFAFALPKWPAVTAWLGALGFGTLLYLHLRHASSLRPQRAALIAVIIPTLLVGGGQWIMSRFEARNVNNIDASMRVYPPWLRVSEARSLEAYFAEAKTLRAAADARRKAVPADEDGDGDGDE